MFWYVLFYKHLIVLHHGDNNFLYSFDICIKFTLSLIIWTMKIWQHLTWCLLFYDKNMFVRKKNILPWSNLEVPPFRKFVTEVMFFWSSRSRMFFKIGVLKNFAIFTGKRLCWPLQAFFYRTPTVTASRFSRQQILFSAESGIYCWQSHLFLRRTPVETRVKRQKQPPKLLCKKRCF